MPDPQAETYESPFNPDQAASPVTSGVLAATPRYAVPAPTPPDLGPRTGGDLSDAR